MARLFSRSCSPTRSLILLAACWLVRVAASSMCSCVPWLAEHGEGCDEAGLLLRPGRSHRCLVRCRRLQQAVLGLRVAASAVALEVEPRSKRGSVCRQFGFER